MKIRITSKSGKEVTVEPRIVEIKRCPAGTAYYMTSFMVDYLPILNVRSVASYAPPSPLDVLDDEVTEHIKCSPDTEGARKWKDSETGEYWAVDVTKTNRERLAERLDLVELD